MNIVTLLLGSGVFVVLLRLTFMLGQYSQRVITLEVTMNATNKVLEEVRHELIELRRFSWSGTSPVQQK